MDINMKGTEVKQSTPILVALNERMSDELDKQNKLTEIIASKLDKICMFEPEDTLNDGIEESGNVVNVANALHGKCVIITKRLQNILTNLDRLV